MQETPRNFALQLGALAALYASVAALITLLFSVVTIALPDAAESYWQAESASERIRFAFAALIIFFPAYAILTRYMNRIRRTSDDGAYLNLTRWIIYLSLFIGGAVILGDAVAVVYGWLNGELTLRFFLKAFILASIVASAFMYYLYDAKGYWQTHEKQSIYCGMAAAGVVLAALVLGFYFMETPSEVRAERIDQQQLSDLREIQYGIDNYLTSNGELPASLEEVYTVNDAPSAPAGRADYRYEVTDGGFNLCAEFGDTSERDRFPVTRSMAPFGNDGPYIQNPEDWQHEAGEWCFARVVNLQ